MSAYLTPEEERRYIGMRKQAEKDLEEATYSHMILGKYFITQDVVFKTKLQNEMATTYWMQKYIQEAQRIEILEAAVKDYNETLYAHYQFLYEYRSQPQNDPSLFTKPLVQQSLF